MDREDIIRIIIGIICLVGLVLFGVAIIKGINETDKKERIQKETYINLLVENERLKAIQELEGDK